MRVWGWGFIVFALALGSAPTAAQSKKSTPAEPIIKGKPIREWVKLLSGTDLLPRIQAVNALIQAGPEARSAAPALIDLFRDSKATFLHPLAAVTLSRIGADAVPALQKALDDKTTAVKSHAALTLGLIGPSARSAVPALIAVLKDRDAGVRQSASTALGRIGSPSLTSASRLANLLRDTDASVRIEAALALWRSATSSKGVQALAAIVASDDETLAIRAIEGLGEIGPPAKDSAESLRIALKNKSPARRIAAAEALFLITGKSTDALPVVLHDLDSKQLIDRQAAVAALGTFAKEGEVVTRLSQLLADDQPAIRREAACALAERGIARAGARPALEAALRDSDAGVRWWSAVALAGAEFDIRKREEELLRILQAALFRIPEQPAKGVLDVQASRRAPAALARIIKNRTGPLAVEAARSLGQLGLDVRPATDELLTALGSDDTMLRRSAGAALASLGTDILPRLVRLLGSPDARLRESAARTLGLIGLPARGSIAALTRLLRDGEAPVRTAAALALWHIEGNADVALPIFNLVVKDVDNRDRWKAVEGMGILGVEASPPIRGLTELLVSAVKDRDARVRATAAKWLWRRSRQAKVVIPLFHDAVTDRDLFARQTAIETLGEMGPEERVVGLLTKALDDRAVTVRLAAVEGLARSIPVKALVEHLASKNPRLRLAVIRALGLIGPDARAAVPTLIQLHENADALTRQAITETLANLKQKKSPTP